MTFGAWHSLSHSSDRLPRKQDRRRSRKLQWGGARELLNRGFELLTLGSDLDTTLRGSRQDVEFISQFRKSKCIEVPRNEN